MEFIDGFRIFYRSMAKELYVRVPPEGAVELVLSGPEGFPDEDIKQLAEALAVRELTGLESALFVEAPSDGFVLSATEGPQIIDLRRIEGAVTVPNSLLERVDVVFVRNKRQPRLRCRQVSFDRNHRVAIEAATRVLASLIELVQYNGPSLEMLPRYVLGGLRAVARDFSLFGDTDLAFTAAREARLVDTLAASWNYRGDSVDPQHVHRWLNQFEGASRTGAISLLKYINAVGYYSTTEIADTLSQLLRAEPNDTQLVSIQRAGKSEQKLLYEMRAASRTSTLAEAIIGPSQCLACVDDVIGSGDTILECLFGVTGGPPPTDFPYWIAAPGRSLTVLAVVGSADGINRIERDPRCHGRVKVRARTVMDSSHSIFAADGRVFESISSAAVFRDCCEKLGSELFPDHPFGWGGCAWGVVAEYNVPDCSLPVIWADDAALPWLALFPRR